ncbi:MAG: ribosome silencing factor [Clostridia bacterium]|nr:ribosome silencing factor [Clostridia bacterium]
MELKSIYQYLSERKCKDIAIYDLSKEGQNFDFVVMATISNVQNNKKLALNIMEDIGLEKQPEGFNKGEWIVFDFGGLVLHLLIPQSREKYNIDKLWQSKKISLKD